MKNITINIVGDSITQGTQYCTCEETYTAVFAKMLAKRYPDAMVKRYDGIVENELAPMKGFDGPILVNEGNDELVIDVIRNGIGGNTVKRALARIGDFTGILPNERCADITVMMFGINDALSTDPAKYVLPDVFFGNYNELIDEVLKRDTDVKLVLMSPTYNDLSVDEHAEMVEKIAKERGFLFIDQCKMWREHFDENQPNFGQGDWLSGNPIDAAHTSPKGAEAIAKLMFDKLVDEIDRYIER